MAASGLILLTPLLQEALSRATSFAARQASLAPGLQEEFANLARLLTTIQAVAEGAEEMQESDPAIRLWLQKLNDAVYDAVDTLDDCDYHYLQPKVESWNQKLKQVGTFISPFNLDAFGLEMAKKFMIINASLSEIRKEVEVIELIIQFRKLDLASARPYYERVHLLDSSKVVGRQGDVSELINLLNDQRSQHPISGISIVGMPGVGKTTVARLIYMKAEEEKLYDLVAWVCASEGFNQQRILGDMLEFFNIRSVRPDTIEVLLQNLGKELEKKTFLLILDDVWEKDPNKWHDFTSLLSKVVKTYGNSIVLTTRSKGVASMVEVELPMYRRYDMQGLSDDECWMIIKEVVLNSSAKTSIPSDTIGHCFAKQCGGLPLVATALGRTLSSQTEADKWLAIRANKEWNLEYRNNVLFVVKMSLDRMPSALKKCFSYCSILPKGFEIRKDDLIQLWMAGGFLQQSNESSITMEEIGNKYFDELLSNFLFEDVERDAYENIHVCTMHDVLHDLALFVSKGETLIWEIGSIINSNIRNLRIKYDREVLSTFPRGVSQRLHCLFLEGDVSFSMESDLKNLRSLKLVGAQTEVLPVSLDESKHLRYLEIAKSNIKALPKSFSKLYMLQTLKVEQCSYLQKLPDDTSKLVSLRHLYFYDKTLMPKGIGQLTSLQTLSQFCVGREEGFRIEELGELSRLRGRLQIQNLDNVTSKSEATKARLNEKTELYKLLFKWDPINNIDKHEEVLEGLQPHSNLKSLCINYYMGEKFPSWMVNYTASSLLDNLEELTLLNCDKCTCLPPLGLLPNLQFLHISWMDKVESMGCLNRSKSLSTGENSITLFPSLRRFFLSFMESLVELVEVDENAAAGGKGEVLFPCVKELQILHCSNLTDISYLNGLTFLEILCLDGCNELTCLPTGLGSCISLQELKIISCPNLISIPEDIGKLCSLSILIIKNCQNLRNFPEKCLGRLTSLKELRIGGLDETLEEFPGLTSIHNLHASLEILELQEWAGLKSLPFQLQHLTGLKQLILQDFIVLEGLPSWLGDISSLTFLSIDSCPKFRHIPEEWLGRLTNLKRLRIGPLDESLEEFPGFNSIHQLHGSLGELELGGWDKLKSVPHQVQHLTALKTLELGNFDGLEGLPEWLGDLSSLHSLDIWGCSNLTHLPSIEAMRHLSNLQYLWICGCPKLEENCTKKKGPEWSKISHIPNIRICGKDVQGKFKWG
ncbi:hypothetical protein SLEP1_g54375 [Rubroshorea leprosula]|uniref:Uncharacterized protein n=1 Tax=Rubroshorea leprosula TaxID=152421 RepID=A0AAV5MG77_9ROSI|nr:hypothetical protein SLEP1_g54375 [Rubroshorea leprosula]